MEGNVYKSSKVKVTHFLIVVHSDISHPELISYLSESEIDEAIAQFEATGTMKLKNFSFPTSKDVPTIRPFLAYKTKIEQVATYRPEKEQ